MKNRELLYDINYWVYKNRNLNKTSMFYEIKDKDIKDDTLDETINILKEYGIKVQRMDDKEGNTKELFIKW